MKLTGDPAIFDVDPFVTEATQMHQLGALGKDAFGYSYRYVKAGASNLVVGNLLQSPVRDVQFTDLACAAAAASQNQVVVTNGTTTIAAGDFTNGQAFVTVTPGIGQTFRIKTHTTGASGASITLSFYENIQTALTTSSKITISQNFFNGVIQSPTSRTGKTVGVAVVAIPATNYGWIGVRGVFAVLSDSTVAAVGEGVGPSTSTAGAVTKVVTLLETVGSAVVLGISAKCEPAYIDLL